MPEKSKLIPNKIDINVGQKLKERRTAIGMSQENLGSIVGVSFQQIQKYEKGYNRIGASRLYKIANALGVNISFFFEDIISSSSYMTNNLINNLAEDMPNFLPEVKYSKESAALVKAFNKINDSSIRKKILSLVKTLSTDEQI